jgi:ribonucleoside-triphosphate reductase
MYRVAKRDGSTVEFELSKISAAMVKAFDAVGRNHHPTVINMLALQVTADFEQDIKDGLYIPESPAISTPEKTSAELG